MLFNSLDFAIFFPIVFAIYWIIARLGIKIQNLFILVASYFFYAWWDWRFLSLIIISTVVDYMIGLQMAQQENQQNRKRLLWVSLFVNLGILGFFKYFNFFVDSFVQAFSLLGADIQGSTLNIILPVGISFYTFQTLSYSIDIYYKKLQPTTDFIGFAAFVSFFPQLVAGPIERASNLLPQFEGQRLFTFEQGRDGCRQILWGLFKKVAIADNCAILVDRMIDVPTASGFFAITAAILFSIQIYCDFSGYSDVAIGTARLLGFDLKQNFGTPYFSRNLAEFWRRWHISLSTWFRDYLYIPLGGSRRGRNRQIFNIFMVFLLSGLWHGASWNFVMWGLIHAIFYIILILTNSTQKHQTVVAADSALPSLMDILRIIFTFFVVTIAWVFFRIQDIGDAFDYVICMFDFSTRTSFMLVPPNETATLGWVSAFVLIMLVAEWINRREVYGLKKLFKNVILRYAVYLVLMLTILEFFYQQKTFIYFQF